MNPGWSYLTADRTQMHLWTRKRRLKFRKRWRKQHGGQNFRWTILEYKTVPIPEAAKQWFGDQPLVCFRRYQS